MAFPHHPVVLHMLAPGRATSLGYCGGASATGRCSVDGCRTLALLPMCSALPTELGGQYEWAGLVTADS